MSTRRGFFGQLLGLAIAPVAIATALADPRVPVRVAFEEALKTGIIYAPYLPLYHTPPCTWPKKYLRKINPAYYGRGRIVV